MSRGPYTLRMIILRVTTGAAMKQATARLCHLWIDFALQRSRRKCKIVTNVNRHESSQGKAHLSRRSDNRSQRSDSSLALKRASGRSAFRLERTAFLQCLSRGAVSSSHANTKRHNGHKASIMGGVAGHNRGILKESEHSIIGKNLSILCTGLVRTSGSFHTNVNVL